MSGVQEGDATATPRTASAANVVRPALDSGRVAASRMFGQDCIVVDLGVDEAEAMGVPMVCGAVVRQMLAITNAKYGASSDFTSIAKVLEEWAGVEMRG